MEPRCHRWWWTKTQIAVVLECFQATDAELGRVLGRTPRAIANMRERLHWAHAALNSGHDVRDTLVIAHVLIERIEPFVCRWCGGEYTNVINAQPRRVWTLAEMERGA